MDFRLMPTGGGGNMFAISGWSHTAPDTLPDTDQGDSTEGFEALIEEGEPEIGRHYRFERDGRTTTVLVESIDDTEREGVAKRRVRGRVVGQE